MVKYIKEEKVKENLSMEELIKTIEKTFASYYNGKTKMVDKSYLEVPKGDFRAMPALVKLDDYYKAGIKWVNVHPNNQNLPTVQASVIICDPDTGEQEYFIEATELTAMRTGAASGVAAKYMSPEDSKTLGIVGAGDQAEKQIEAVRCVRDIEEVIINDIDKQKARDIASSLTNVYSSYGSLEEACSCDIVCSITPTTEPIVSEKDIKQNNKHINAFGADSSKKQEYKRDVMGKRTICVDDKSQAFHSGEISSHIGDKIDRNNVYSLGEIVEQRSKDKSIKQSKTIFDSTGLAIQDIASCRHII